MSKRSTTIFSKPDEMQMVISYQAMRLTWIIVNIIWVGMAIYYFVNGGFHPVTIMALVLAQIIYLTIYGVLRWRMTRGGEDKE